MAQSSFNVFSSPTHQEALWSGGSRDVAAASRTANNSGAPPTRLEGVIGTTEPRPTPAPRSSLPRRPMLSSPQPVIPCPHRRATAEIHTPTVAASPTGELQSDGSTSRRRASTGTPCRRGIAAPDSHNTRGNFSNSRPMDAKRTHGVNPPPVRSNEELGYTADAADRVGRAEQRAEEAEEARRVAEEQAAAAESEMQRAHDETERLRFEAEEMARWRDAVLQVREMLESAGHAGPAECQDAVAGQCNNGAGLGRMDGECSS